MSIQLHISQSKTLLLYLHDRAIVLLPAWFPLQHFQQKKLMIFISLNFHNTNYLLGNVLFGK